MSLAIFDIDGVLADARWRLPLIARDREGGRDFDAFYAKVGEDEPFPAGVALVESFFADWMRVVFVTGRSKACRYETLLWLRDHVALPTGFDADEDLVMRPEGDHRKAAAWKLEQVERITAERGEKAALIVDDDPDVCAALTAAGYPVLRAMWGRDPEPARDAPAQPPAGFWRTIPCRHPPEPHAWKSPEGHWACHCGRILDPVRALPSALTTTAPGPLVPCDGCGCHVKLVEPIE